MWLIHVFPMRLARKPAHHRDMAMATKRMPACQLLLFQYLALGVSHKQPCPILDSNLREETSSLVF
jgi:hypothetical protein